MTTGQTACPNCGYAYDSHGLGGNCPTPDGRIRKPRPTNIGTIGKVK